MRRIVYVADEETGVEHPSYVPAALLTLVPDASLAGSWTDERVEAAVEYGTGGTWSAADIHWGMQRTYDFYREILSRSSYDGKGAPIYNFLYLPYSDALDHYFIDVSMNNAAATFASVPPVMVYGMGDGRFMAGMYPVVELSIMAHEFTHLVTAQTANLEYLGESGALNESFSDLLGISVKKHVQGDGASWLIGEGMMRSFSNLRSMSFPKMSMDGQSPSPDTYQGEYWVDTEDAEKDHGGVHTNSGVQNKWFFLITDGDAGTNDNCYNYEINGMGIEKSRLIAYRTLTEYATQESQYADIRLASLQATKDLFGEESDEVKTVEKAWDAVGVGGMQTAIKEIKNEELRMKNEADAIYNLAGQRLSKMQRGINIVNGKKIAVK